MKHNNKIVPLALLAAICSSGAPASAAAPDKIRVVVAFQPGKAAEIHKAAAVAHGAVVHEIFGMDAMALEVPAQALKGLQNNPNVLYVEEDEKRYALSLTKQVVGTASATCSAVGRLPSAEPIWFQPPCSFWRFRRVGLMPPLFCQWKNSPSSPAHSMTVRTVLLGNCMMSASFSVMGLSTMPLIFSS